MNTKKTAFIRIIIILQLINSAYAQDTYQFGLLPSLNVNKKLKSDWSLNTKIESRQLFQNGDFIGNVEKKYKYVLTDFSLITAKKIGLNSRMAGGYFIRLEKTQLVHRFIQQYTVVQRLSGYRLAHRFLSDQTLTKDETLEFRIRYRITAEVPLNGEALDPGEFYFKINNEYLNSFQDTEYNFEMRLVPLLGYDLTESYKIETGLDYRINSFFNNSARHSFWISLNFFIEI